METECTYCGKMIPNKFITKDHFIPKSKGGRNIASNIVPACRTCNCLKSNRVFDSIARAIIWIRRAREDIKENLQQTEAVANSTKMDNRSLFRWTKDGWIRINRPKGFKLPNREQEEFLKQYDTDSRIS